jgi:hypothetical protein
MLAKFDGEFAPGLADLRRLRHAALLVVSRAASRWSLRKLNQKRRIIQAMRREHPVLDSKPPPSWLRDSSESQVSVDAFRDGRTLVVFAHQDDDLLWMLPFWPVAAKFVLAGYQRLRFFSAWYKVSPVN